VSGTGADRPDRGALRAGRCLIVTAPSVALGAAAHALGQGCVSPSGLLTALLVVGAASWSQLARERSFSFFLAWTTLGQALVHGVLTVMCPGGTTPAHAATAMPPVTMLLAHGLAVLLVSLVLRRADARVWALARLARELRSWVLAHEVLWQGLVPVVPTGRLVPAHAAPVRVLRAQSRAQGRPARRGPPVRCCP
jgi:hypothetical protein